MNYINLNKWMRRHAICVLIHKYYCFSLLEKIWKLTWNKFSVRRRNLMLVVEGEKGGVVLSCSMHFSDSTSSSKPKFQCWLNFWDKVLWTNSRIVSTGCIIYKYISYCISYFLRNCWVWCNTRRIKITNFIQSEKEKHKSCGFLTVKYHFQYCNKH